MYNTINTTSTHRLDPKDTIGINNADDAQVTSSSNGIRVCKLLLIPSHESDPKTQSQKEDIASRCTRSNDTAMSPSATDDSNE